MDGYSSLPPKPTGDRLNHVEIFVPEHPLECLDDIERTLHGTQNGNATIGSWTRDHALGLDIELLLVTDPIFALHDPSAH